MRRVRIVVEELGTERSPLILVSYDKGAIQKINDRHELNHDELRLVCPAKYALFLKAPGRDDDGVTAQVRLTNFEEYGRLAIWFDDLSDLPVAIERLREKFPGIEIPNHVTHIIDWPFDRTKLTLGSTIIDLESEVVG